MLLRMEGMIFLNDVWPPQTRPTLNIVDKNPDTEDDWFDTLVVIKRFQIVVFVPNINPHFGIGHCFDLIVTVTGCRGRFKNLMVIFEIVIIINIIPPQFGIGATVSRGRLNKLMVILEISIMEDPKGWMPFQGDVLMDGLEWSRQDPSIQ